MIPFLVIGAIALWLYNRAQQPAAPAAVGSTPPALTTPAMNSIASLHDFALQPDSLLPGGPASAPAPHTPAPAIYQSVHNNIARTAVTNFRQRLQLPAPAPGAPGEHTAFFVDVSNEAPTDELRFLKPPPLPEPPTVAAVSTISATPHGLFGGGGVGGGFGGVGGGVGGHGVNQN